MSPELLQELSGMENAILAAHQRRDFSLVAALLDDSFTEHGSCGQVYDKALVLAALREIELLEWSLSDFQGMQAGSGQVTLTFHASLRRISAGVESKTNSRRESVWVLSAAGWRLLAHRAVGRDEQAPLF